MSLAPIVLGNMSGPILKANQDQQCNQSPTFQALFLGPHAGPSRFFSDLIHFESYSSYTPEHIKKIYGDLPPLHLFNTFK